MAQPFHLSEIAMAIYLLKPIQESKFNAVLLDITNLHGRLG